MAAPTLIFLDTTAFSQDSTLASAAWDSLQSAAQEGLIEVAISQVTVREIDRQVGEKAAKLFEKIRADNEALCRHAISVSTPVMVETGTFQTDFLARLKRRFVQVRALPRVSHAVLVDRDIAVRKPFNRSGKGYRDALIWHSFLEWCDDHAVRPEHAIFVTSNVVDFGENDKAVLSEALKAEIPTGLTVRLERTLADAVAQVRKIKMTASPGVPEPPEPQDAELDEGRESASEVAQRAGLRAFNSLLNQDWEGSETFPFALHPIERTMITWVEVDEATLEAQLVDSVSETQIWEVRASAELTIEGMVYRGDATFVGPEWDVSVGSFEDRYVEATRAFRCTLVADVRVEADIETTDAYVTEIIADDPERG